MQSEVLTAPAQTQARPWWLSKAALRTFWLAAGLALLVGLGAPPVQRTQEARVLETARQMLGTGWRGWIGPMLNGKPRLRKPPLCYWMAAGAYEIGGVSETAGRFPTALLGWLTIGLTFAIARWLFGVRAGLFAAGLLLSSYLFFRFSRLAETDAPSTFFVTLAVYAFWRAIGQSPPPVLPGRIGWGLEEEGTRETRLGASFSLPQWLWFHVAAAATALAVLSKGPPGGYPILFLLALVALHRKWTSLWRFVASGAPLTLLVVGLPWFIYIFHTFGLEQWRHEIDELGGQDHPGHFYLYFYQLLVAAAPWCLLLVVALIAAVRRRRDPRIAGLLLWAAVIFLPLCVVGNKQFHYLMPLMPPLMILIGWWVDEAINVPGRRPALIATLVVSPIAIPAVLLYARFILGRIGPADWALAGGVALALLLVAWIYSRYGPAQAIVAYAAAVSILLSVGVSFWAPRFEDDGRQLARQIDARFGRGPYCFYGPNLSLPLCFNLRAAIPQASTAAELQSLTGGEPQVVVIAQAKSNHPPPPLPQGFMEQGTIHLPLSRQTFTFYRLIPQ